MRFPPTDTCFLCNEKIDFADSYEFAVSWPGVLPRGAERPVASYWVHDACAREAGHAGYPFDPAGSPAAELPRYTIRFPEYLAAHAHEIEAKGVLADVAIVVGEEIYRPVFYDATGLAQDVAADVESEGLFSVGGIVVVPHVTREHIEAAVKRLSRSGFSELRHW